MTNQQIELEGQQIRLRGKDELKNQGKPYSSFYVRMPAMLYSIDKNGRILDASDYWLEFLGYERNEVIGRKSVEFLTEESRLYAESVTIPEFMKTGYARDIPYQFVTKNGEIVDVLLSAIAEWDVNGKYSRSLAILTDITEQKRVEREKLDLQEKLAQAQRMESLGLLAGGVAHDLNNIIGPIMAYPDLIKKDLSEGKSVNEDLDAISSSAKRAADVISDLLALTRRGRYKMESIDLNDLVNDFLNSAECNSTRKLHPEVKPDIRLSKNKLLIKGSKAHLPKVITNLIINACESMPEGGILSIISSSINVEGGELSPKNIPPGRYILLTIEDQGEGIAEEDISKIFDPFFSTKTKTRKSGTGLGLSVVYNVLKDHGAYIDVESKLGLGTKFSIYFPQTIEKTARTSKVKLRGQSSGSILVVDDRKGQRDIAKKLLTSLGYEVECVERGQDAVEYVKRKDVDLIILDMILEDDMDGLDTYEEIIKIKPLQKTVIVSGLSESNRVKEAEKLGVNGFIQKPYKINDIGIIIQTVLKR